MKRFKTTDIYDTRNFIKVEYLSLMLTDDTVSDFTDCFVRNGLQGVEILTKDNTVVYYYHHTIKGYTYKIDQPSQQTSDPHGQWQNTFF